MFLNYKMKQILKNGNLESNIRMCMNLPFIFNSIYLNLFFKSHFQMQLGGTTLGQPMYSYGLVMDGRYMKRVPTICFKNSATNLEVRKGFPI